jgi:hypothetical protein
MPDTGHVLSIRKADADWPAAVVWNFPVGGKGALKLSLMLKPGFHGARIGLTDHYSVPWDDEDGFFNVFNLHIAPDGEILPDMKIEAGKWHDLELAWDVDRREVALALDGKHIGVIQDNRRSSGINYMRLRSTAAEPDTGLLLRLVTADVSSNWLQQK